MNPELPFRYVRGGGGSVIHGWKRCHWAEQGTAPWNWAEGMEPCDIIDGVLSTGGPGLLRQLRFCYFCFGRTWNLEIAKLLGMGAKT